MTPNQQVVPAVKWCMDKVGLRVYLVGSDYIYSRVINAIIKDEVSGLGGTVLGEAYLPLGGNDVKQAVHAIQAARPSFIINSITGDTNTALFDELLGAGLTPDKVPVLSFSIAELTMQRVREKHGPAAVVGDLCAWSYFQSLGDDRNRKFVSSFRNRFGEKRGMNDPMESIYFGVHLWAQAAETTKSLTISDLRESLGDQTYAAPEGLIYVDPKHCIPGASSASAE